MGKSNSERLAEARANRGKSQGSSSSTKTYRNSERLEKSRLEREINFDTFETDLKSVETTVQGIYGGWQTTETMKNTKSTVEAMHNRISKLQTYQSKYGSGASDDVTKIADAYSQVLGDWDNLSSAYGYYKNEDAYNAAKKKSEFDEKFKGLSYDDLQAKLKEYAEDSDEYKYLKGYTGHTNLNDFDRAIEDVKARIDSTKEKKIISSVSESVNPSPQPTAKKEQNAKQEKTEDEKYLEELERQKNLYKLQNGVNDYYSEYMEADDFQEKSQYKSTVRDEKTLGGLWVDKENEAYEYINDVNGSRDKVFEAYKGVYGSSARVTTEYEDKDYDRLTDNEKKLYNYLFNTDKELAQKYLDDMEVTLSSRRYGGESGQAEQWKKESDGVGGGIASSIASIPMNVFGGAASLLGNAVNAAKGKEYNPYANYNMGSNYASVVRENVGQNIAEATEGAEFFGTNVPSFLYQTGMSIGDTALGAKQFGRLYTAVAGTNAFQQKALELTEAGESNDVVMKNAVASGLAEAAFEYISLDKLFKIKNVDDLKSGIIASFAQGGIEGVEEFGTETANIAFDEWFRGENSQLSQLKKELIARGYTEKEAYKESRNRMIRQVAEALAGGILSGVAMGGAESGSQYHSLSQAGNQIRNNDRVQEMWDMSAMTPQESEAYALYESYANQGVTSDSISNAQLGNLYTTSKEEAVNTLSNRKAKSVDVLNAQTTLSQLQKVETPKPMEERKVEDRVKSLTKSENTVIASTGERAKIQGIKTVDGDTVVVTDQGDVLASEMEFSDNDAQIVAYAENMNEEKGNLLIAQYDGKTDAKAFVDSFEMAYAYGETGIGSNHVLANRGVLTETQAAEIYKTAMMTKAQERKQGRVVTTNVKIDDSIIDRNSSTTDGSKVNWNTLTTEQKASVTILPMVADKIGVNLKFTRSEVVDGEHKGANGSYDPTTNTWEMDVYAGRMQAASSEDLIIPIASHEITHSFKYNAAEAYAKLSDYAINVMAEKQGISHEKLIRDEMYAIKKRHPELEVTEGMAIDEIVARTCEDMFANSEKVKEVLSEMDENEKKTFVDNIKKVIKDVIQWINDLLAKYKSNSAEAKLLRQYKDEFQKMSNLWDAALTESINNKGVNEVTEKVGVTVDMETESAYPSQQFSERTWTESEYVANRDDAIKNLSKALKVSEKKAAKYIDSINSVAKMIADDRVRLDYDPNIDEKASVMKPNSDYKWSIDMSTLCAKRLLFTGTFDEIQRMLPNTALDSDDIVKLRKMMMDRGYQVACGICYVESTRREIGTITNEFIEKYKESQKTGKPITRTNSSGKVVDLKKTKKQMETTVDKSTDKFFPEDGYTPTLADLNTTDIDLVKRDHPLVYEAYLNFMNARGQSKPKLLETRAEYKGEIAKLYARSKNGKVNSSTVSMNASGGLRLQSFSDFEIAHLIDMMQIVMDMSNVGLMSQAYTKVPEFAEVFGDTGVKINLSLIAKGDGLDADGNLIFDDVEGIDHKKAFELRDKFSKNVGTILVGKNDAHIIKAMADPRIDYIIPFHKSSWKESLYDALGLTGYADYTKTQHEKAIDGRDISDFKPSEYWDFSKSGDENAQIYLEKCREDGRIPKFPQFQGYDGYWKLLIDFKMYDNDGVGSPQTEVMPNFEMDAAERILNSYEGGHKTFPVAKDVVKDFVAEYKAEHKQKQYSDRDSEGNTLTKEQMEFFKDSKVRDESGNLQVVYHGTPNGGFNEFALQDAPLSRVMSRQGAGYYFTDKRNAQQYMKPVGGKNVTNKKLYNVYLNIKNPLEITSTTKGMISDEAFREVLKRGNYEWAMKRLDVERLVERVRFDADRLQEMVGVYRGEEILSVMKEVLGYDGVRFTDQYGDIWVAWDKSQIKNITNKKPTVDTDIRYSDRGYAPTFYSHMGKVVDDIKQSKLGANSVVNYLKGKGVKDEEIKWSGIETFLEGKKSVTKEELQEFVAGSMLQIEEETLNGVESEHFDRFKELWKGLIDNSLSDEEIAEGVSNPDAVREYINEELVAYDSLSQEDAQELLSLLDKIESEGFSRSNTKWGEYKTIGGKNYRELLFKMPASTYINDSMQAHWKQEGVLAHARMQDFQTVDGKKMLFVEEIQSDWHNAGAKNGYRTSNSYSEKEYNELSLSLKKSIDDLANKAQNDFLNFAAMKIFIEDHLKDTNSEWKKNAEHILKNKDGVLKMFGMDASDYVKTIDELRSIKDKLDALDKEKQKVPDAPFHNNYHEYVLKRLIRMAAEEGYDSIGWTPAEMQAERWSPEFMEGYRIEYDQDIPKFLRKYGKKWGASVGKSLLPIGAQEGFIAPDGNMYSSPFQAIQGLLKYVEGEEFAAEVLLDPTLVSTKREGNEIIVFDDEGSLIGKIRQGKRTGEVWSMDITESMKGSVLHEGQVMYSDREYMDAVERGDMETAQKMVDAAAKANGYDEVVYHGTNADKIDVFIGSPNRMEINGPNLIKGYFSDQEAYSDDYGSNTFKYYINSADFLEIRGAFDVDEMTEYLNDNGVTGVIYNDFITDEEELEYWQDSYGDTIDPWMFFNENGGNITERIRAAGYKGVYWEEGYWGYDGGYAMMPFESNLVKSADPVVYDDNGNVIPLSQRFNSSNDDVRFSDRDSNLYDVMGENKFLKKQNEKLANDIARLKERLKLERQVTNGNTFNENQLSSVAGYILKLANSDYAKGTLAEELNEVYSYIVTTPNLVWDDLMSKSYEVAKNVLDKQRPIKVAENDYFKDVLADIRKTRISLSDAQVQEAKYTYGDKYRNAFMGKVILANDGVSLDQQWQVWSNKYPEIFDAEVTGGNQITALYDIHSSLKEGAETYQTFKSTADIRSLAVEIYNQYWNVSPIRTTADKYEKQIKRLNFEHRKAMKELRQDYKDKLEEQKLADSIYYGKIIKELRNRKAKEVQEAREFGRRRAEDYRDRVKKNAKIESITKKALTLNQWLTKNSKKEHVPDALKPIVENFLTSLDFSSKRYIDTGGQNPTQKDMYFQRALSKVHRMMSDTNSAAEGNDGVQYYGTIFPQSIVDEVGKMVERVEEFMPEGGYYTLNTMSLADLETLDVLVSVLKNSVTQMNRYFVVKHAEGVTDHAQGMIAYADSLGTEKVYNGMRGAIKKLINWRNLVPYYAFNKFGESGMQLFEAFQDGWDTFAFKVKKIMEYAKKAYTDKEVRKWKEEVKTIHLSNGKKVKMTTPQIMSLYCLMKREQARRHILEGLGIRVADIESNKKEVIRQVKGTGRLTEGDVMSIIDNLTERQKEVADILQEFMQTTCAEWGNEVTMKLYGYRAFGEENYFPIKIEGNNLVTESKDQENSIFRLLNMSFTKSTNENARNTVVVSDIFDVFAQHTSDMAKYNAFALPVFDAFKWYNYTEKLDGESVSVKGALENAFGKDGKGYVYTFLQDINGAQNVGRDTVGGGFFTNAKIASVAGNLRVVALQPTSWHRAYTVIGARYLYGGLLHTPKINKAEQYCGMALWKSMGYYDTNIQRGLTDRITHNETKKDKFIEATMKGAEVADKITLGYLWNACELETRSKRKDLKVGSDEFYQTVAKRLREVIYRTQVVDSTMTRSEMMRGKDGYDKMLTAFASEPTLSLNMLQDAFTRWKLTERQTGSKSAAFKKHGRYMLRTITSYTVTAAVASLVESGFDIYRDDEEEIDEDVMVRTYLENLWSNLTIIGKVPYFKEIASILKGFSSSRSDTQWMESLGKAFKGIAKIMEGKGNAYTTAKDIIKAFSYVSGLPFYNAWRDTAAGLNKADILTTEDLEEIFDDTIGEIFRSLSFK